MFAQWLWYCSTLYTGKWPAVPTQRCKYSCTTRKAYIHMFEWFKWSSVAWGLNWCTEFVQLLLGLLISAVSSILVGRVFGIFSPW